MNHEFLLEQLKHICDELNKIDINYYVVGALAGYIDCDLNLIRNHDDVDIMIPEKDIEKVKSIFNNSNYIFYDNRTTSDKVLSDKGYTEGKYHEVYAQYKYNDFHIGFLLYEKDEKSFSVIEYFRDNNVQKKLIRILPIKYFPLQYNDDFKIYRGIKLKTSRVECIYLNKKNMGREKDLFDINVFGKYIDQNIINSMSGKSKYRIKNTNN